MHLRRPSRPTGDFAVWRLDSLAGAVDELIGNKKKVVLVSHQSSTLITSKQNALVGELRSRTQNNQLYVPVTINKGQEEALEFTQRTRSFLFATLGIIVARMFGKNELNFFENGIISLNFPISEHVIGARASRTTHPRVLADFSRFFSQLLSEKIVIRNPFIWKTKSEVVQILADRGCADLIAKTLSCTRVRETTRLSCQCGTCSQCVDRRFAILAADLAEYEPADNYAIDLFREHARPCLTMVESTWFERRSWQLCRTRPSLQLWPGVSRSSASPRFARQQCPEDLRSSS